MEDRELISLRGEIDSLRLVVEELRAAQARQQGLMNNFRPEPQFDRLKPDLPGFFLRRYGVGGFDKVILSAGYAIAAPGTSSLVSSTERTFTLTADRYFFAKWDHQTGEWTLSSGNLVHDDTAFPTPSERYTILPIAKATWSAAIEGVATITIYHTGLLFAPTHLPIGTKEWQTLNWRESTTPKKWEPGPWRGMAP